MSNFLKALPIVAKALSENYGVKLDIVGNQAFAAKDRIVLPVLPEDDDRAKILARGYLDHEAGHVKHSDFESQLQGFEKNLANVLEDVRIELAMGRRYPGCRENLDALTRLLAAEGDFKPLEPTAPPAAIIQGYLLHLLRARILGQRVFEPMINQDVPVFDQAFPGLRCKLEPIALEVKDAPDTQAVLELVRRIMELLQDQAQPSPQPQPDSSGNQKAKGNGQSEKSSQQNKADSPNQDDSSSGDGQGEASEGKDQSDSSAEPGKQGQDDLPESQPDTDTNPSESGQESPSHQDDEPSRPAETVEQPIAPRPNPTARQEISPAARPIPAQHNQGIRWQMIMPAHPPGWPDRRRLLKPWLTTPAIRTWARRWLTSSMLSAARKAAQRWPLRFRLGGITAGRLQNKSCSRQQPGSGPCCPVWCSRNGPGGIEVPATARRLNLGALHRLSMNDSTVFLSRQERRAVNTAVYLLMDQSYSMKGRQIEVAFMATAALARALITIPGTAVAAGAFSTHFIAGYSERRNYVASLLKYEETACRMNLIVPPPEGGTPMAEAIYCAAAHLLMRREPRRLLVVLTDGEPNDVEATQEIIEKCRCVGMEVYGIGILDNRVIPVFGKKFSSVVNTIGELPERMFRLLANCL